VYRGVVPLTIDALGRLHLEGADEPIEWLVKMRRLPADRMLDRAIAGGTASEANARKVGALLAGFYPHAPPVPITGLE
jgi:aminoglycoside phosphotransferase family enzyme